MAQENYVEGCSMQRPPLLEPNGFCFWKARFETYVKSKDIDLWQVIQNVNFYFEVQDEETKLIKETPYELFKDTEKKKLGKNEEAKMTIYNALLHKEYEQYSQTSKVYIVLNKETMRIEESLNVTFDESLPEPKSSSSVEDDRIDEPIVQYLNGSPSLQVNVSDEGYPKSLKEARGHPIKQVIGELNERTLRSKTKHA
ncbi:hypothetical protein Tco_0745199 [Tanacetum coccineum]